MRLPRLRRKKAITHAECCARAGAVGHDGPCKWCPQHDGSHDVAQVRYNGPQEYEDYSTDIRPLVLAKRG